METKYKILIIDDDEIVLDSCTEILAASNHQLKTAGDGILGVKLMKEFQPDLIIVDLKMPGISGLAGRPAQSARGVRCAGLNGRSLGGADSNIARRRTERPPTWLRAISGGGERPAGRTDHGRVR